MTMGFKDFCELKWIGKEYSLSNVDDLMGRYLNDQSSPNAKVKSVAKQYVENSNYPEDEKIGFNALWKKYVSTDETMLVEGTSTTLMLMNSSREKLEQFKEENDYKTLKQAITKMIEIAFEVSQ